VKKEKTNWDEAIIDLNEAAKNESEKIMHLENLASQKITTEIQQTISSLQEFYEVTETT